MITDLWHSDPSSVRMEPESAIPRALDDNGDKELSTKLSISELILNLRTAFQKADYDHVEEVLVSKETKLKNKIKILTDKLELERMEKMSVQDELRKQCKMRKDGANFIGDGGEAEELFGLQGNNDPGVSINVNGEKDMNHVDICYTEPRNITTGLPPSQRKDLKSVNTHLSVIEVTRHSPGSPNMAVIGTSGFSTEDMEQQENNEVDIDDHEFETFTAGTSQRKTDNCGNTRLAVDDYARQSPDNPNTAVLGALEATTKNAVDIHDHECGNTTANTSPAHKKKDCRKTHLIDDDSRQSPDTTCTAVLGASEARTQNSVDEHDHECGNIAAGSPPSQRKADDCGNTYLAADVNARQSLKTPNTDVLGASEATTEDAIDVHDHECGNIAANTAPYQRKTDDCGNTHLAVDDDARQSPDTPNIAVLGALGMQYS